jgi:hypothetical protein
MQLEVLLTFGQKPSFDMVLLWIVEPKLISLTAKCECANRVTTLQELMRYSSVRTAQSENFLGKIIPAFADTAAISIDTTNTNTQEKCNSSPSFASPC